MKAPRENLYRGVALAPTVRASQSGAFIPGVGRGTDPDGGGWIELNGQRYHNTSSTLTGTMSLRNEPQGTGSTMFGHFAVFDTPSEINSVFEGRFIERIAPGAFKKTFRESRAISQFDHGYDPSIGDAPLGPFEVLREDDIGAYYEVPLLDTDYNRDRILPLLEGRTMDGRKLGSQLGASFRFNVIKDTWDDNPDESDSNPKRLPERTIKEVALHEAGPVVFPAYPEATAGVRSLTDHYLQLQLDRGRDPQSPEPDDVHSDEPARSHSHSGLLVAVAQTQTLELRKEYR